jgi:hypothetical protein
MTSPSFISKLIAPFTCPRRLCLYAGVFFGALGGDILTMMFSYRVAANSVSDLLTYWILYFIFSGLLLLPLLCGFYCRASLNASRTLMVALTILGFICYWLGHDGRTVLLSFATLLIAIPFWTCYHLTLIAYGSDEGRGHEISVAYAVMAVGAVSGYFISGPLAAADNPLPGVAAGFITTAIGTATLLGVLPAPRGHYDYFASLVAHLRKFNTGWLATLNIGGHNSLSGYLLPTFLGHSGFTALATGITLGLRAGSTTLAAPLTGHLISGGRGTEMRVGITLFALAWAALLLPVYFPAKLAAAIVLWAAAGQFYSSGMDTGWYSMRTPDAVAAREILLNLGRLALMLAGAPWVFASPATYPLLALVYALGLGGVLWMMTLRRKTATV